jgi:hypothetical protein
VPAWKDYQERTADYYRALGLSAHTEELVEGVRGKHIVDVVVRGYAAGVEFLWIVECKHRNRRVEKAQVATLAAIVQDTGADRGLLMSERGYQAGAISLVTGSNITLTSLSELQTATAHEHVEIQCHSLITRCKALDSRISARVTFHADRFPFFRDPPGNPYISWVVSTRIHSLMNAVLAAREGLWPITIEIAQAIPPTSLTEPTGDTDRDLYARVRAEEAARRAVTRTVRAENFDQLLPIVASALDDIEIEICG